MGVARPPLAAVAWAFGLSWIALVDPIAGWCGTSAVVAGVAGLAAGGPRGSWLAAVGAATLAHAAWLAADPIGLLALGGAVILRFDADRGRVALGIGAVAAAEAGRQILLDGLLPGAAAAAPGLLGVALAATAALGVPPDARSAGLGVALAGGIAAARGASFLAGLGGLGAADAAAEVAARRAVGGWPAVESAALAELARGDDAGVRAVVRAAPTRVVAGEALARARGVEEALDAGWSPGSAVDPGLAPDLAWALVARGRLVEARAAVSRADTPATAFHRAAIADLSADTAGAARALAEAIAPAGTPVAPGVVWSSGVRSSNFADAVVIDVRAPVTRVVATGRATPCDGPPVLTVQAGSRPPVALALGDDAAVGALALPPGAIRLVVRWDNDQASASCDRNLEAVSVALEP